MRDVLVIKDGRRQFGSASRRGPYMKCREKSTGQSVSHSKESVHTACIVCFLSGLTRWGGSSEIRQCVQACDNRVFPKIARLGPKRAVKDAHF